MTEAGASDLDARYGRRPSARAGAARSAGADARADESASASAPRSRLPLVAAAVLVIGVVAFWWLTTFGPGSSPEVRADLIAFDPQRDTGISATFQITAPPGSRVACALEAQDERHAVVGWRVVELPAVEAASQTTTQLVRTVGAATTVLAKTCWIP